MTPRNSRKPLPPLDPGALQGIAIRYVERYQTSRERLLRLLRQKIRQRGWADDSIPPDLEALADRMVELGYVNDAAFAQSRADTYSRRGLGEGGVRLRLRAAGVGNDDADKALEGHDPLAAALDFARRKRFGPFGKGATDPKEQNRQLSAMARAGHPMGLARAIIRAETEEYLPEPEY